MPDFGMIFTGSWAVAAIAVWGMVLSDAIGSFKKYHDRRAKREVIWAFALFLVGCASCVSILFFIFARDIPGFRGFASAVALGAFLGAGIVIKTFSGPDNENRR